MNCFNLTDEDVYEYIVEAQAIESGNIPLNENACVRYIDENWGVVYNREDASKQIEIGREGYYSIPKPYGLMQDTDNFDESGISYILAQPGLDVRGQDIIIGFVDTGIDYLRDEFKRYGSITKILAIWDQTINSENADGEALENETAIYNSYGKIYTAQDINRAIAEKRGGNNPYDIVPSRDENGHGTFIAGIAAGSQTQDFIGAAPEAELLVVKLKRTKKYLREYFFVREDAESFAENDIMAGIAFLLDYAGRAGKPLVICMGLGSSFGSRKGTSPLARQLQLAALKTNVGVVICTGNEAAERTHTGGSINSERPRELEINTERNDLGFCVEIWPTGQDVLSVSLISPTGETIPRIPARLGTSQIFEFLFEGTTVYVDYRVVEKFAGSEVIFIRFSKPSQGIWKIRLYGLTDVNGKFNAWMSMSQFTKGENYFVNSTPEATLTDIATASFPISVGGYNHANNASYIDSGRGNIDENIYKPDLCAPAVSVEGLGKNTLERRTGTSIAAAHTAGATALLFCWGITKGNLPFMGNNEAKSILIRGAKRENFRTYPDNIWGYGTLDLLRAFDILRRG